MNKLNRKTPIILLILIIIAGVVYYNGFIYIPYYQDGDFFIAELVFRENYDGIVGNPDFVPSFIEVNDDTFMDKYNATASELGFDHTMKRVEPDPERYFKSAFEINDDFHIEYDEGFFIMEADTYRTSPELFNEVLRVLLVTLDPEAALSDLDDFLSQETPYEFLDYNYTYLSSKVDFRFYDDDGPYMLQVEDLRMGH
jgi:hypothetical protein